MYEKFCIPNFAFHKIWTTRFFASWHVKHALWRAIHALWRVNLLHNIIKFFKSEAVQSIYIGSFVGRRGGVTGFTVVNCFYRYTADVKVTIIIQFDSLFFLTHTMTPLGKSKEQISGHDNSSVQG